MSWSDSPGTSERRRASLRCVQGQPVEAHAVQVQQVECVVDDRRGGLDAFQVPAGDRVGVALHHLEVGQAVLAKRDDLAVEDHLVAQLRFEVADYLRELGGDVPAGAALEYHRVAADVSERAVAVELGLEDPAGMGERALDQPGLHRLQRGGKRRRTALGRPGRGRQPPLLQVLDGESRVDRAVLGQDFALRVGVSVPVLDEEPVAGPSAGADEGPRAAHLASLQGEGELPGLQLLAHPAVRLVAVAERQDALFVGRVDAGVPDDHLARAVAALGDYAFEAGVVQRVVFDHGGEALLAGVEGRPLGDRPRLEHAVDLQPYVVMEARRGVLLHDEAEVAARRPAGRGLGRL